MTGKICKYKSLYLQYTKIESHGRFAAVLTITKEKNVNRFCCGLISIVFMGFYSTQSHASIFQWATGCVASDRPEVLSLSYDTDSKQVTLYRTHPLNQSNRVERFTTTDQIRLWTPVIFKGYVNGAPGEVLVEFQSKATMYIVEGSERIQYTCDFYSFDLE